MKGTLTFINRIFLTCFQYPNFKNINSPKRLCLWKNYCLLLLKTHRSNFKCNDLLHMLNIYKIPAKEHQVVDFWVADQISASEVLFWKYLAYFTLKLHNYKKLKTTKFLRLTIFSIYYFFYNLYKNEVYPLNITFLHKFLDIIPIKSMKNMFLWKNLLEKAVRISYSLQIWAKFRKKCLHWNKKSTLTFINRQNLFFSKKAISFMPVGQNMYVLEGIINYFW